MQFCSVTAVLAETILRELREIRMIRSQVTFAITLAAAMLADAIAIDNCRLRKWKRNHRQTINQNVVGRFEQRFNCDAHRPVARAEDVNPVDLNRIYNADGPSDFGIRNQRNRFLRVIPTRAVWNTVPKFGKNRRTGNNPTNAPRPASSMPAMRGTL
jgi:hypothetical protein